MRDDNTCSKNTEITTVPPAPLPLRATAGSSDVMNVKCFGDKDGSLTINPSGGTPPYQYPFSKLSLLFIFKFFNFFYVFYFITTRKFYLR